MKSYKYKFSLQVLVAIGLVIGLGNYYGSSAQPQQGPTTGSPITGSTARQTDWMQASCDIPDNIQCPGSSQRLLLVSLDGFRADYLQRKMTPVISRLTQCGVHTPYLRSVFPTMTFPNQYSIVTGLYPESHGIVGNTMYDEEIGKVFKLNGDVKMNSAWWKGEPIWITAKKQGKKTAAYFWVGSDVNISGIYPDEWHLYDGGVPFDDRVDRVLKWASTPEPDQPDLMLTYFNEPDRKGHGVGPNNEGLEEMLASMDGYIRKLMDGLTTRGLHQCLNIIIMADHGMTPTSCSREVNYSYFTDTKRFLTASGTYGHINTRLTKNRKKYETEQSVNSVVEDLECKSKKMKVFTKETVPKRHHVLNSNRIGNILLQAEDRWLLKEGRSSSCFLSGNHGYDNILKSMEGLFVAYGPAFKQNFETKPFENIELYNLMCDVLGIEPSPNNGTQGALDHLLRNVTQPPSLPTSRADNCVPVNRIPGTPCMCNNQTWTDGGAIPSNTLPPLQSPVAVSSNSNQSCYLRNADYSLLYSHAHNMALWSAFRLAINDSQRVTNETFPQARGCVRDDPRVETPVTGLWCPTPDNFTKGYLFEPVFSKSQVGFEESHFSSNIVVMKRGFSEGVWTFALRLMADYSSRYGSLSVVTGPIWDRDVDGHADRLDNETRYLDETELVPIPTHYYMILMKCSNGTEMSCDHGGIDIVSFILPHVDKIPNCLEPLAYLKDNVARVRDIELLTGLQFFTDIEPTLGVRLRTFLPVTIWPTSLVPHYVRWMDTPCEIPPDVTCPASSIPLLIISLDGFRADYLQRNVTPAISRLAQCGVHTPYMRSVFPTVTFPNQYTIVTGLYPESHGIVGNRMYDENIGELFTIGSRTKMNPAWWDGEPIWITAKKQGKKTAAYFWVGSDVNISGIYPDEYHLYDGRVSYDRRVDRVLDWVSTSDPDKPDLMLTYFDEPDSEAHDEGPGHLKVDQTLTAVDEHIETLMDGLATRGLHHCVNILIVADHGMSPTDNNREVDYSKFSNSRQFLTGTGTYGYIDTRFRANRTKYPTEQPVDSVVNDLECVSERMKVFTKETVPKRHHIMNSNRIGNILLDAEDTWLLTDGKGSSRRLDGNHGYDTLYKSMQALFLAYGPGFKQNFETHPFENIELYNLICNVLGIEPAPNNGTQGALDHLLRNPPQPPSQPTSGADNCESVNRTIQQPCMCNNEDFMVSGAAVPSSGHPPRQHPVPVTSISNNSCITNTNDYDLLFSQSHNTGLWAAFTLSFNNESEVTAKNISDTRGCIRDNALSEVNTSAIWCQDLKESTGPGYLFEPYFASTLQTLSAAHQTTNIVPMHNGFLTGVWTFTQRLVMDYSSRYGGLSVVTGPIWDRDADGHADRLDNETHYLDGTNLVPIPTHYYVVIMKCANNTQLSCDHGGIDIVSFILPHVNTIPNCLHPLTYLKDNVARVRDIELLTGLQFFTDIEPSTLAVQLRTFLSVTIWPSSLEPITTSWSDIPCPERPDVHCPSGTPPLLLIGLDGFGPDFLKRNITPTVQRLGQCGVRAPYMRPVYPTTLFPNSYTIVTGLYPESHGLVANTMFDKVLDTRFTTWNSGKSDPSWWGGEPIWNTAIKQGKTAASYFWVGSDIKIQGMQPNMSFPYKRTVPYEERVSTVLRWLDLPVNERPDFITLYFDKPDYTVHRQGKDSVQTNEALELVDSMVGRLMDGLVRRNLHTCVNIIVVADHGMVDTSCQRQFKIYDYLNATEERQVYVFDGADAHLATSYRYDRGIVLNTPPVSTRHFLDKLQCKSPHVRVGDKNFSPVRTHYKNNDRIPEILLRSDPGWLVSRKGYRRCNGGNHGWDNIHTQLGSLFVAHGPSFKNQMEIDPFENIELYNLMAELLDITPAPNNGTVGSLRHVLKSSPPLPGFVAPSSPEVCLPKPLNFPRSLKCSCANDLGLMGFVVFLLNLYTSVIPEPVYGPPRVTSPDIQRLCHLHAGKFSVGFNTDLRYPSWILFSIEADQPALDEYPAKEECFIEDPRAPFPAHFDCTLSAPNLTLTSLVPKDFVGTTSRLSVNTVLMYDGFRTGVWWSMWRTVQRWTNAYSNLSVTAGPVFDYNQDGLADTPQQIRNITAAQGEQLPLATHFYLSAMRCERFVNGTCDSYGVLSFVLPHLDQIPPCWDHPTYLHDNVVRIRDIELLTGLQFLTKSIPPEEALKLRLYLPVTDTWSN